MDHSEGGSSLRRGQLTFPLGWYFETELKNRLPLQVTNQRLEVPALEHSAFLYLIGAQPCTRLNAVLNAASDV